LQILFTTDTIQRGGKERQLFVLSTNLIRKGYDVHIVTLNFTESNYINEYNFDKVKINVIDDGNKLQKYFRFREIIKFLKPDIVFSWDFQTSLYNLLLYQKYSYKFINGSIQHGIRLFSLFNILRSIVCWLSPFVIANSFAGFKVNNIKPAKNHFVLYNGIESKFNNLHNQLQKEEMKSEIISEYKLNPGIVFVSVANMVPYKDYYTVLTALKRLRKEFDFYYFIIGNGPLRKEIEIMVNEFELSQNVVFTGKISNVERYLRIADIIIHSSRGEGISNAILEGMYSGLPVIATNVGGISETVFPGSSLLFPYKDHEALYQCLLKSKELKESFNQNSEEYQTHLKKFSVETMVSKFEEIIQIVLRETKK